MNKKSLVNFWVFLFVVIAVLLKAYFLSQRGYEMDIATFLEWSGKIRSEGFWSLYSSGYQSSLDYPPLVPLIGKYWLDLRGSFSVNELTFFKLMPTVAELFFSLITALIVYRSKSQYKIPLLAFVIIQPALGLITSAWGQVDSILSLFIIGAFVLIERNLYLSSLLLFLAFLTKPQAVLAIFIYFLILLFRKGFLNFMKQVAFWLLLIVIMVALFSVKNSDFLSVYLLSAGRYPHLSMNAFNFWWLFFGEQSHTISDAIGTLVTYKNLGFLLFGGFLIPAVLFLYKKARTLPDYFLVLAYIYIIFFNFPTQIHERYIFPALALLPIAVIRDKRLLWSYILLSITLFVNNYAILQYAYPQFPVFNFLVPESWVGDWTKVIAAANVGLVIYLAFYLSYEAYKKD